MFENMEFNNMSSVDFDSTVIGDGNMTYNEIDVNMANNFDMPVGNNMCTNFEPVEERVMHRTFVHEVPHVCPIRTKIINHHIYKHTYRPEYTCCEENEISNIQCGSCCNFNN